MIFSLGEPRKMNNYSSYINRRQFMQMSAFWVVAGFYESNNLMAKSAPTISLPFTKGTRQIVSAGTFPQKGELILQRMRPPLLETPWSVFENNIFTPNDMFYVRWHMPDFPLTVDVTSYRIKVFGEVDKPIEISLNELMHNFKPAEIAAVNQCAGNSRGFVEPRVPGAQWAHGAMGNAIWTGVTLKDLLAKANVKTGATHVAFRSLENGMEPFPPRTRFEKVLTLDHALDGEVMVAYAMNHEALPVLNGFPVRLVVPGWYSTYWVKMLTEIEVMNHPGTNYWMAKSYLIPDTPNGFVEPGATCSKMVPVNKMNPRSFFTGIKNGAKLKVNQTTVIHGIAFGGNTGLARVMFSSDSGATWQETRLKFDYGKYSFRKWEIEFTPKKRKEYTLMVKAVNTDNEEQPMFGCWNFGGYMYNAIERITVKAC